MQCTTQGSKPEISLNMEFVKLLMSEFEDKALAAIAEKQQHYMKNKFAFFGIKTAERRMLQKPFFVREQLPDKREMQSIVKALWAIQQRECQYVAQELAFQYVKNLEPKDIRFFVFLIQHKSWWDTVDFIAVNLVGAYFKRFPELKGKYCQDWLTSDNIWLQRTALLFQLKYKHQTDTNLMAEIIQALLPSKEFFIQKAIGWMLREYSKTNTQWVRAFIDTVPLPALSRREAKKYLSK